MVKDLDRAVRFYIETLRLALRFESRGHWAQVEAPGLTIGLHPPGETGPTGAGTGNLSIGLAVKDLAGAM